MNPDDDIEKPAPTEDDAPVAEDISSDPLADLEADVLKWRELAVRPATSMSSFT